MSEWISFKDKMPPPNVLVLCCGKKGGRFLGDRSEHAFIYEDGTVYFHVPNARHYRGALYWMHIPDAP